MDIQPDKDALIVVDAQKDFFPGGSLGVEGGDEILPVVNGLLPRFEYRVFTRDWHPPAHTSFSDPPEFRDMRWPAHAVQNTEGAEFHPELEVPDDALEVKKAMREDVEEYSGFQSSAVDLGGWLRERGIERVFITGLATDYCVANTALDARKKGFRTVLVEDGVRGVAPETTREALENMEQAGVSRVTSDELLS